MQLLSIQEVSDLLKVPKPTLRFWEKELAGIIVPLRSNGGQRRYTAENISTIEQIRQLREHGMNLAQIKRKLRNSDKANGNNSDSDRIDLLANRIAEVVRAEISRFLAREK